MDPLRNLAPGATYKLPSVEQMREEVESGVFSPESKKIAQDILAGATKDETWEAHGLALYNPDADAQDYESGKIANAATERELRDPENDEWFADAIDDDWWTQQEPFGAPLNIETNSPVDDAVREPKRQKSFIEKQTDDIMKRVTAPVDSMNVDHIKPSDLKKLSKSASKAFEAASQMADATKKVIGSYEKLDFDAEKKRKPDQRGAHLRPLQHRPFFTNAMRVLRDELENQ